MADSLRRGGFVPKRWWAALLIGWGGFQLYDGIVQHKILRLHQIRYHVIIWPYDVTWNVIAALMIIVGLLLMQGHAGIARGRGSSAPAPARRPITARARAMLGLIPLALTLLTVGGYGAALARLRRRSDQ